MCVAGSGDGGGVCDVCGVGCDVGGGVLGGVECLWVDSVKWLVRGYGLVVVCLLCRYP